MKPFVKSNKNDFVGTEPIAEAIERKNMRFFPIKTDDQFDSQAIHRGGQALGRNMIARRGSYRKAAFTVSTMRLNEMPNFSISSSAFPLCGITRTASL